jgi:membrane protease YdiL (CAAX protease family)
MTILVLSLLSVVDYVFHSNDYQFVFTEWSLGQFATMLLLSIMLIPIQTAAEEIFFRGYLLQGFGRKIKNPYILSFVIGVLFTLPHLGNPEVAKGLLPAAIGYFIYGFLFSLITLWSNGLELAMGIHCANNLFIAVGIGMTDSALTTRPIYLINEWDIWNSVFLEVVLCILLYFIMIRYIRKNEIE